MYHPRLIDDQPPAAPAARPLKQRIMELVADCSIEVTPKTWAKQPEVSQLLPRGTRVYIAFLPGEAWAEVARTAAEIRAAGLTPVPHCPARTILDEAELAAFLAALQAVEVDQILVIGGSGERPRGAFAGTLALLRTGLLEAHGIRVISVAGHPEGQPAPPPPAEMARHDQKWQAATARGAAGRLVTQFLFDPAAILAWERRLRAEGNPLPIHVGIAGPASLKTLLNYGRLCGVGNSLRFLTRQPGSLLQLTRTTYPDGMIAALAAGLAADRDSRIERLHVFPFGGLMRTAGWLAAVRAGRFTLQPDRQGFAVDED